MDKIAGGGKNVTSFDIDKMLKEYPIILQREFIKHFDDKKEHIKTGKNFLSHHIAEFLVEKILKLQRKELIEHPEILLFIESVEAKFSKILKHTTNGEEKVIRFEGYVDRIDSYNDETRILDYKSGKCDDTKVTIAKLTKSSPSTKEALKKTMASKPYVFQLLIYNMLYKEQYPNQPYPQKTGILSMVNIEDGPHYLINKLTTDIDSLMELFEESITDIVSEIYDKEVPFEHNPESKYCQYCR